MMYEYRGQVTECLSSEFDDFLRDIPIMSVYFGSNSNTLFLNAVDGDILEAVFDDTSDAEEYHDLMTRYNLNGKKAYLNSVRNYKQDCYVYEKVMISGRTVYYADGRIQKLSKKESFVDVICIDIEYMIKGAIITGVSELALDLREFTLETDKGSARFYHDRICCEGVYLMDWEWSNKLIGSKIERVHVRADFNKNVFYEIETTTGSFDFRFGQKEYSYYGTEVGIDWTPVRATYRYTVG